MRHKKKVNHLSRQKGHREALLANMASSLIMHKRIKTTTAKAKALKIFVEPLITKSKDDTTHSRRQVFSYLRDKEATSELFREIAVKVGERPGGYTRIIKLGNRLGDNADMCIMELVDYNENLLAEKAAEKKSSSRRRRGGKKTTQAPAAQSGDAKEITQANGDVEEAEGLEEVAIEEKKEVDVETQAETTENQLEAAEAVAEEKSAETKEEKPAENTESTVKDAEPEAESKEKPSKDEAEDKEEKKG